MPATILKSEGIRGAVLRAALLFLFALVFGIVNWIVQGQPLYIVGSIARGPVDAGGDRDEA